jgi:hypothetical protein
MPKGYLFSMPNIQSKPLFYLGAYQRMLLIKANSYENLFQPVADVIQRPHLCQTKNYQPIGHSKQ